MGALQIKRGPSTDRANYTPLVGELILDSTTYQLFVGDGTTAGGIAVVGGNANVTIISNYSNSNVASFLPTYTGNITANVITANSFVGNLSLTNIPAGNLTGTIPGSVLGNSTTHVGTTAVALNRSSGEQGLSGISSVSNGTSQLVINANSSIVLTSVGNSTATVSDTGVTVSGTFSVSGNSTVNSLTSNTTANITGNLTAGNLITSGVVSATGNITGGNLITNGNVYAGNIINSTGNIQLIAGGAAMFNAGNAGVTIGGNVNISSGGTGGNNLVVAGNVTGNVFNGNGSGLTGLSAASIVGTVANATYALTSNVANTANTANTANFATNAGNANTANLAGNVDIVDATANSFYPLLVTEPLLGIGQAMIDPDWPSTLGYLGFNPATNMLQIPNANIYGNLTVTGNVSLGSITANIATYVTTQAANTTSTTQYITFVGSNLDGQNQRIKTDNGLGFLPDSNTLSAGNISTNNINITANATINGTSTFNGASTFNGNVSFQNYITVERTLYPLTRKTGATGVVTHDCSAGEVFVHTSMAGSFDVALTNFTLPADTMAEVTLILVQGATVRSISTVQIPTIATMTPLWDNAWTSAWANKTVVAKLRIYRDNANNYVTLGNLTAHA